MSVSEFVVQFASKVGENVALGRIVVFETPDGLLDAYRHVQNERGTIGVLVELNCESDFVARTDDFQTLLKEVALQVAAAWARREATRSAWRSCASAARAWAPRSRSVSGSAAARSSR